MKSASLHADALLPLTGRETLELLRVAITHARARVWVLQFLVDARPEYDTRAEVRYLMHALAEAACRGIDVRVVLPILLDTDPPTYDMNLPAARFMASRGVAVRRYAGTATRPYMHAKAVVVDDDIVIGGNVNWTPDAFSRNAEQALAMRSAGVVDHVARRFARIWNQSERMAHAGRWQTPDGNIECGKCTLPVVVTLDQYAKSRKSYWPRARPRRWPACGCTSAGTEIHHALGRTTTSAPVRILDGQGYVRAVIALLDGARRRSWVSIMGLRASTTPKLRGLLRALSSARDRGVDVRVLYDERDAPDADWTADVAVLRGHVPLRRWGNGSHLHSRSLLVDDADVVIGSEGWTPRSVFLSEELGFHVHDVALARRLANRFDRWWRASEVDGERQLADADGRSRALSLPGLRR